MRASTYTVFYHCTNCNWSGEKRFPRGKEAPEKYLTCPKCACNTLVKGWTQPIRIPRIEPVNIPSPPKHPFEPRDPPWQPWRPPNHPYSPYRPPIFRGPQWNGV